MKSSTIAGAALGIAMALLSGCKKDIQNKDAVRQGLMNYLSKRADLLAMDVNVTSVSFNKGEAIASVRFQAKGNSAPGASLAMDYVLERNGDQWVVKGKAGANSAHGAGGVPPGMPPAGATPQEGAGSLGAMPGTPLPGQSGGALPPGHPAVGSGGTLPPGHPSIPNNGALPPGHPSVGDGK